MFWSCFGQQFSALQSVRRRLWLDVKKKSQQPAGVVTHCMLRDFLNFIWYVNMDFVLHFFCRSTEHFGNRLSIIKHVYNRFLDCYFGLPLFSTDVFFPEKRFPYGHFQGWDNFLWLICRRTLHEKRQLIYGQCYFARNEAEGRYAVVSRNVFPGKKPSGKSNYPGNDWKPIRRPQQLGNEKVHLSAFFRCVLN